MSVGQLLDFQDRASGRDRLKIANAAQSYVTEMGKRLRLGTLAVHKTAIYSLFNYHGVPLPRKRLAVEDPMDRAPDKMDRAALVKLFEAADLRGRALIQIMFSSGMGYKEFSQFNMSWPEIKKQLDAGREYVMIQMKPRKQNRMKGEGFFTFLGKDSISLLRQYLEVRGELKQGDVIFEAKTRYKDTKGKNLSRSAFSRMFIGLAKRTSLINKDDIERNKDLRDEQVRYGLNPYTLRDAFRTEFQRTPADRDVAEFMMGHNIDKNKYLQFLKIPSYCLDEYRKAEQRLSFIPNPEPDLVGISEVEALKTQVQQLQSKRDTRIEDLETKMKEQEGDVVFVRNTVTGLLQVYEAFLMKTFGVRTLDEAVKTPSWKKLVGKEKE